MFGAIIEPLIELQLAKINLEEMAPSVSTTQLEGGSFANNSGE